MKAADTPKMNPYPARVNIELDKHPLSMLLESTTHNNTTYLTHRIDKPLTSQLIILSTSLTTPVHSIYKTHGNNVYHQNLDMLPFDSYINFKCQKYPICCDKALSI